MRPPKFLSIYKNFAEEE
jgi:hypothetical protein